MYLVKQSINSCRHIKQVSHVMIIDHSLYSNIGYSNYFIFSKSRFCIHCGCSFIHFTFAIRARARYRHCQTLRLECWCTGQLPPSAKASSWPALAFWRTAPWRWSGLALHRDLSSTSVPATLLMTEKPNVRLSTGIRLAHCPASSFRRSTACRLLRLEQTP